MVTAELDPDDPQRIRLVTAWKHSEMVKSIPGTRWDKDSSVWRLPLSWPGCLALRSTFGTELEIGPNLKAWAFDHKATRIDPAMELRDQLSAELYPDLFPHQNADVMFLTTAQRGLLGNEPGTGKTASAIRTMLKTHENGENPFPALVVCPNTMKTTWANEFKKWWPGVKVAVLKGTAAQRRKLFAEKGTHVTVLNWEALRTHSRLAPFGSHALRRCKACGGEEEITEAKCQVHPRELNAIPFKTVIADEIHRAKDAAAQQTRALWAATGDAKFRYGLTGTPVANSPQDLWALLHWMDPQGYPQKTKFIERFLDLYYNGWGFDVLGIKATAQKEFFAGFDPRFRRMTKKAVLPFLPPILRERRWVEMTPKQKKAYKQMSELMLAELDDGSLLVAPNSLTRMGRLIQFASAYGELTPPDEEGHQNLILSEPSSKVAAFMDDLEDFGNESLVVFCQSKQLLNLLDTRLDKAGVEFGRITGDEDEDERQEAMDRFQSGASKLVLCTIAAGGVGITLTAASTAVFLQRSWSRVDMEQAINRVHRIGSEVHDKITIIDYITPDTAELAVLEALDNKSIKFEEVVRDAALMRKILKGGALS